jgi:hypothetical protein
MAAPSPPAEPQGEGFQAIWVVSAHELAISSLAYG